VPNERIPDPLRGAVQGGNRAIARTMGRSSQIGIIAFCVRFVLDRILYAAATLEPGLNPKCLNC